MDNINFNHDDFFRQGFCVVRNVISPEEVQKYEKFHWRSGDQKIYISNISKIKSEYNWSPKIGISEGLDKVIGWIRENDTNIKKILKI